MCMKKNNNRLLRGVAAVLCLALMFLTMSGMAMATDMEDAPAGGAPGSGAASIAVLIFSVSQPCTDSLRKAARVAARATAHNNTHRPSAQPARRSHLRKGPLPPPEGFLWPGWPALGEALPPRAAGVAEEEDGGAALCS